MGPVEHEDDNLEIEEKEEHEEQAFHIEGFSEGEVVEERDDSGTDTEEEQVVPSPVLVQATKRGRVVKPSAQVGAIKKSKYGTTE